MNTLVFSLKQLACITQASANDTGIVLTMESAQLIARNVFELCIWQREASNQMKVFEPTHLMECALSKTNLPEKQAILNNPNLATFSEDVYYALDDIVDSVIPHKTWDMHVLDVAGLTLFVRNIGDYRIVKFELQQRGLCHDNLHSTSAIPDNSYGPL